MFFCDAFWWRNKQSCGRVLCIGYGLDDLECLSVRRAGGYQDQGRGHGEEGPRPEPGETRELMDVKQECGVGKGNPQ